MLNINTNLSINKIPHINLRRNANLVGNSSPIKDSVSFSDLLTNFRPTKNKKEIYQLTNLFYDGLDYNLYPKAPTAFLDKIIRKIVVFLLAQSAKKPSSITEIVETGNKINGGYSIDIRHNNIGHYNTARINFFAIAPEHMRTKFGMNVLKEMGSRIVQHSKLNNVKEISWEVYNENKIAERLFKRLKPQKVASNSYETKYKISLESFENHIKQFKTIY